jgi:hypothetical protein
MSNSAELYVPRIGRPERVPFRKGDTCSLENQLILPKVPDLAGPSYPLHILFLSSQTSSFSFPNFLSDKILFHPPVTSSPEGPKDWQAPAVRLRPLHQQDCCGTVSNLARIASRCGAVLLEHGLQLGQAGGSDPLSAAVVS